MDQNTYFEEIQVLLCNNWLFIGVTELLIDCDGITHAILLYINLNIQNFVWKKKKNSDFIQLRERSLFMWGGGRHFFGENA